MPIHKPDRRVLRTEKSLREALIALILEKGYDAVTVQDILDRANMGRSTFYAHFRDKEDLLLSGFQVLMDTFQKDYFQWDAQSTDPAQTARQVSLFFFRHADSHRGLFNAMIGEQSGKIIQEHAHRSLRQAIYNHLQAQIPERKDDVLFDILADYIASSYLAMLTWWLKHDRSYTPEQMHALLQQLVFPGVMAVLKSEKGP